MVVVELDVLGMVDEPDIGMVLEPDAPIDVLLSVVPAAAGGVAGGADVLPPNVAPPDELPEPAVPPEPDMPPAPEPLDEPEEPLEPAGLEGVESGPEAFLLQAASDKAAATDKAMALPRTNEVDVIEIS